MPPWARWSAADFHRRIHLAPVRRRPRHSWLASHGCGCTGLSVRTVGDLKPVQDWSRDTLLVIDAKITDDDCS